LRINCKKVHELLSDYLDDELKEAVLKDLEGHLDACPDCVVQVDSVKKVIRLYRDSTPEGLPVDIRIRLQDVLKRAREEGR
jgi:predicted anti-sigma-YlaC factor YlaD